MWWVIAIAAVVILLVVFGAQSGRGLASLSVVYSNKLQALLKEEFPDHKNIFTTSFCSIFFAEYLKFAKSKTGKTDDIEAIRELESVRLQHSEPEAFDLELFALCRLHFPKEFSDLFNNEYQYKKLDRALEAAATQTAAELENK